MSVYWETEQLAYRAMGKTEDEAAEAINNGDDLDAALFEKYEISFDQYAKIVRDLLPFTPKTQAAVSGDTIHAFVDNEQGLAIVTLKVES